MDGMAFLPVIGKTFLGHEGLATFRAFERLTATVPPEMVGQAILGFEGPATCHNLYNCGTF